MLWFKETTTEEINQLCKDTLVDYLNISIDSIGESSLKASMPVNKNSHQPYGILHGGVNCVLAETLGSIASNLICNPETHHAVGLNITTSHIKAIRNGKVYAEVFPVHLGRKTHVWEIVTRNGKDEITSKTQFTTMIIARLSQK